MKKVVADAFVAASGGHSADRVIVDPELNARFIEECRRRDLDDSVVDLNRTLLNSRKTGGLSGRPRAKSTHFGNEDQYRFAAEIAVRFLERRDGLSLDSILCDPVRAAEFDDVAQRIAPGYSPLQYRWAALNLRKAKGLTPELVARVSPPIEVVNVAVRDVIPDRIPSSQGLYLFISADKLLYVGEAENLRTRLKCHLDHSDCKGLARWIWEFGVDDLHLEMQILDDATTTRARKALELELIRSRNPVFNIKR